MAGQKFQLDVTNINNYLMQSLVPYLGPGAMSTNLSSLICKMVGRQLYPYNDYDSTSLYQELTVYGLELETAAQIVNDLVPTLHRMTFLVFKRFLGENFFDVRIVDRNTLLVEDLGPTTEQDLSVTEDLEERFIQDVMQDIDDGSWVPPKIRQAAGVF